MIMKPLRLSTAAVAFCLYILIPGSVNASAVLQHTDTRNFDAVAAALSISE